jgi:hypothetical protein
VLNSAGLVLTIGYDAVEYWPSLWNRGRDRTIVHVDVVLAELDNDYDPAVELIGSIEETLSALTPLALSFALPASLFVGMTEIPRELLLQRGRLVLALILAHVGLFLVAWILLRGFKTLQGPASIICALMLATSATPVFGIAVLQPCSAIRAQVPWDSLLLL